MAKITHETTWKDTVYLTSDIIIKDEGVLNIEPGTKVLVKGWYAIRIQDTGRILARGTEIDSITFCPADTTGYTSRGQITTGAWHGIRFDNMDSSADSSIFHYCIITHGKAVGDFPENQGGAIYINGDSSPNNYNKISISNSKIKNSSADDDGGGISIYNSNSKIINCKISNNKCNDKGGGIYLDKSNCYIFSSIISNNFSEWDGGGIYYTYIKAVIAYCKFMGNSSFRGGGIRANSSSSDISYCTFYENNAGYGGGIHISGDDGYISNCLMTKNNGGGLTLYRTDKTKVFNCNIIYNEDNGIYSAYSDSKIYNSICWGNTKSSEKFQVFNYRSDFEFYNCIVEGGNTFNALVYQGCIEADPLFTDSSNNDYSFKNNSPCINAGDTIGISEILPKADFNGNLRIWNDTIDIGVYEYIPENLKECSFSLSENIDFGDINVNTTKLDSLTITNTGNIPIEITNIELLDCIKTDWNGGTINAGNHQIVKVSFTPTDKKTYSGIITINFTEDIDSKAISVTGSGSFPTGTIENSLNEVVIYPNPFSNEITIKNNFRLNSLTITNSVGQRVLFVENPESTINTEALNRGVYFITIENDKNQKVARKFIKK